MDRVRIRDQLTTTPRKDDRAEVKIWDVDSGRERLKLDGDPLVGTVQCVAISPDGKWIATGGGYYKPRTRRPVDALERIDRQAGLDVAEEEGSTVMAVAFHPDGKTLAVGYGRYYGQEDATGDIRFFDVATGKEIGEKLPGPVGGVNGLSFSPDGRRLAVAGYGCTDVWELATPRSTSKKQHARRPFQVGLLRGVQPRRSVAGHGKLGSHHRDSRRGHAQGAHDDRRPSRLRLRPGFQSRQQDNRRGV